jgi:hypothetical protein
MIRFLTALLFLGVLLGVVTAVAILFCFCFKLPASDRTFGNLHQTGSGRSISHTTHHVGI